MFTVRLKHIWSNEVKTFEPEDVTDTYVSIRWGMSGVYDLNLKANVLTARSQKAQRKGKPLWQAEDIEMVRAQVKAYMDKRRLVKHGTTDKEEAIAKHKASMPLARCK